MHEQLKQHTYLFQEGLWIAKGYYIDEKSGQLPVEGKSHIVCKESKIVIKSHMTTKYDDSKHFDNNYEVRQPNDGDDFAEWVSLNSAIGKMRGKFVVVAEAILSTFRSENGTYSGSEYLKKIDGTTYENRGFLFEGEKRLSSWVLQLSKVS